MISPKLSQVFRDQLGNKHYGLLSDPEDRFDGDTLRARRILRVNRGTSLTNGSVVKGAGDEYLLFEHSTDRFLAFEITHWLPWSRRMLAIDPVSLMNETYYHSVLDEDVPAVVEINRMISEKGLETNRYQIRAGGDFQPGDRLGPYEIHSIKNVLGACIMEAFEYGGQ